MYRYSFQFFYDKLVSARDKKNSLDENMLDSVNDKVKYAHTMREDWKKMKKISLLAVIFCVGVGLIVYSHSPASDYGFGSRGSSFDALTLAFGLLLCIISGVPLVKVIKEYLT